MKLIEALKRLKDLAKKAEDLREKIGRHSAYLDFETPVYSDQRRQVAEWLQAHGGLLREIARLRLALQRTNLATAVTIELDGRQVTHSITEWIGRRRDLAILERDAWRRLTDRGLKEGEIQQSTGEKRPVKIVRCYDPAERDRAVAAFDGEPSAIDAKLEIANAVTDLLEGEAAP